MSGQQTPPGWYHAEGDPAGSTRWWDGSQWVGEPQMTQATNFGNQPQDPAAPPQDFGAPPQDYGVPPQNYGTPPQSYGTPPQSYGAPPQSFGAPPQAGQYGSAASSQMISPLARMGGRFLDWIIWVICVIVASIPLIGSVVADVFSSLDELEDGSEVVVEDPSLLLTTLVALLGAALIVAYETYGNLKGGTLGKRAANAQVLKADGSPLDLMTSFRRMWPYIGLTLIGLIPGLGDGILMNLIWIVVVIVAIIMLFADNRNQTPWDKLAGTIVVSKDRY